MVFVALLSLALADNFFSGPTMSKGVGRRFDSALAP